MQKHLSAPTLGSIVDIDGVEWVVCGYKLFENEGDVVGVVLVPRPLGVVDLACLQIVPLNALKAEWRIGYQSVEAESFVSDLNALNSGHGDGSILAQFYDFDMWKPRVDRSDMQATVLLPVGSILDIGSAHQRHMVIGYYPIYHDVMYDYLTTPYPQGMFEFPLLGMINQGEIDSILYQPEIDIQEHDFLASLNEIALIRQETNAGIIDVISRYRLEQPEEMDSLLASFQFAQVAKYNLE